jgi:hypothetical protein
MQEGCSLRQHESDGDSLALSAELADVIEESRRLVEKSRWVRGVVISREPDPRPESPKG